MKGGKLKYELNSYTLEIIPQGGALVKGNEFNFINILLCYFLLWGTSMPSRPSTTTTLKRGTKTARVSQPIGLPPNEDQQCSTSLIFFITTTTLVPAAATTLVNATTFVVATTFVAATTIRVVAATTLVATITTLIVATTTTIWPLPSIEGCGLMSAQELSPPPSR